MKKQNNIINQKSYQSVGHCRESSSRRLFQVPFSEFVSACPCCSSSAVVCPLCCRLVCLFVEDLIGRTTLVCPSKVGIVFSARVEATGSPCSLISVCLVCKDSMAALLPLDSIWSNSSISLSLFARGSVSVGSSSCGRLRLWLTGTEAVLTRWVS